MHGWCRAFCRSRSEAQQADEAIERGRLAALLMLPLNPIDAIAPAMRRTGRLLYSPFRFGRTFKLCLTGYLGFGSTLFVPFPLLYLFMLPFLHSAAQRAWLVVGALVASALWLALLHVLSRLQMASFDIVLHLETMVRLAWRRTRPAGWRWSGVKFLATSALALIAGIPLGIVAIPVIRTLALHPPGQQPGVDFFVSMIGLELGLVLGYVVVTLLASLLSDFVLPPMLLENVPTHEAWRRFVALLRQETGQVLGFAALKAVLAVMGYVAQTLATYVVLAVVAIVAVALGSLGYVGLHAAGVGQKATLIAGLAVALPLLWAAMMYAITIGAGTLMTFLRAYGLYFLGGRYPLLGGLLEASMPLRRPPMSLGGWPQAPPLGPEPAA
jgi:hypothetical protein